MKGSFLVITYRFIRRIVGEPTPSTVLRLRGYGEGYNDIEITVTTESYPEDGTPCTGTITKSNRESLFTPGEQVSLVRRMNDVDISMD